ncbi:MAG: dihydropteroate synthase [Hyphomicrobiales bacterium]
MPKTYLRPVGLSYGADAARAVTLGRAGRLGGSAFISFNAAEIVTRDGSRVTREAADYGDLPQDATLARIEAPRPALCGLKLDRPRLMGIVNVTPDSFSDGGQAAEAGEAIAHGLRLAAEGAHLLDVGGESTRPGSEGVAVDEELARVIPVIRGLAQAGHIVSCDTRKARAMREAAAAGAAIINDVSALQFDPDSLASVAELGCPVVLMHARGDPRTMQLNPYYDDVTLDVYDMLEARIAACTAAGIGAGDIVADPGIGFGKTFRHNLDILSQLTILHGLGVAVLVGLSRKGFIGALAGEKTPAARVSGSIGGAVQAALNGAHVLRVHDVKATAAALAVALAAADPEASGL